MSSEFSDFLIEQMAGFGAVSARRMFGAAGLYRDGVMFAIIADDVLYFRVGNVDVEEADRIGFELLLRLLVAFDIGKPADPVTVQAAMQ